MSSSAELTEHDIREIVRDELTEAEPSSSRREVLQALGILGGGAAIGGGGTLAAARGMGRAEAAAGVQSVELDEIKLDSETALALPRTDYGGDDVIGIGAAVLDSVQPNSGSSVSMPATDYGGDDVAGVDALDAEQASTKDRPIIDATHPDFGAVGDGSTNDQSAIQAAIDHADSLGGGIVKLPQTGAATGSSLTDYGTEWIIGGSSGLTVKNHVTLDFRGTAIVAQDQNSQVTVTLSGADSGLLMEDALIDGKEATDASNGLNHCCVVTADGFFIKGGEMRNGGTTTIFFGEPGSVSIPATDGYIEHLDVGQSYATGVTGHVGPADGSQDITWVGGTLFDDADGSNAKANIGGDTAENWTFIGVTLEDAQTDNVRWEANGAVTDIRFVDCTMRSPGGDNVEVIGSQAAITRFEVADCLLRDADGNGVNIREINDQVVDYRVTGNTIDTPGNDTNLTDRQRAGIQPQDGHGDCVITDNTVRNAPVDSVHMRAHVGDLRVTHNTFPDGASGISNATIWKSNGGDVSTTDGMNLMKVDNTFGNPRRQIGVTTVAGDNTAHNILQVENSGLVVVMGREQGANAAFSDLVNVAFAGVGDINTVNAATANMPGARSYSYNAGLLRVAIDDSGTTYNVTGQHVGGRVLNNS